MANLNDLKSAAEKLLPIIKDLFDRTDNGDPPPPAAGEVAAVTKLLKLVSEAGQATPMSAGHRAEALIEARGVVTEVLIQAAQHSTRLTKSQVRQLEAERIVLRDLAGLELQRTTFEPIARLLPPAKVKEFRTKLKDAEKEIKQRETAKKTLDTTVKVVIILAKIAAKVVT